jgi:hypothetical protein
MAAATAAGTLAITLGTLNQRRLVVSEATLDATAFPSEGRDPILEVVSDEVTQPPRGFARTRLFYLLCMTTREPRFL